MKLRFIVYKSVGYVIMILQEMLDFHVAHGHEGTVMVVQVITEYTLIKEKQKYIYVSRVCLGSGYRSD